MAITYDQHAPCLSFAVPPELLRQVPQSRTAGMEASLAITIAAEAGCSSAHMIDTQAG